MFGSLRSQALHSIKHITLHREPSSVASGSIEEERGLHLAPAVKIDSYPYCYLSFINMQHQNTLVAYSTVIDGITFYLITNIS